MRTSTPTPVVLFLFVCGAAAQAIDLPSRDVVIERVRKELATILEVDPKKLPADRPVTKLGADDLDVVEWAMAVEEAYDIKIPDEMIIDGETISASPDLTISTMADIVLDGLAKKERPPDIPEEEKGA